MNKFPTSSPVLAGAKSVGRLVLTLAIFAIGCLGAATAHASNSRTWVSGTGTNNTQCSVTQPCQSFAQAIAVTANGGEIDCLDPGDFGPVVIGISVTIDCEAASNGGIMVTGGAIGININVGSINVNLIGLNLNGAYAGGNIAVSISAGATVNIRNCKIYGFPSSESAIYFHPATPGGSLVIDNDSITENTTAIIEYVNNGSANLSVRNSNITGNTQSGIIIQAAGGAHAGATIEQTTLAFNSETGLLVSGSGAVAVIGNSTMVNNGTGVSAQSGGVLYSFKNNQIGGNSTDGTPLTAYPGGPLN
jgi:hypothetical protein